jgi:hypothetical protein
MGELTMAAFSKMNSVGTGSGQYLFIGNWMGISEGVDGRCRFAGVGTRHVMLGKKGSSTWDQWRDDQYHDGRSK